MGNFTEYLQLGCFGLIAFIIWVTMIKERPKEREARATEIKANNELMDKMHTDFLTALQEQENMHIAYLDRRDIRVTEKLHRYSNIMMAHTVALYATQGPEYQRAYENAMAMFQKMGEQEDKVL